jgi:hypothetical protein
MGTRREELAAQISGLYGEGIVGLTQEQAAPNTLMPLLRQWIH